MRLSIILVAAFHFTALLATVVIVGPARAEDSKAWVNLIDSDSFAKQWMNTGTRDVFKLEPNGSLRGSGGSCCLISPRAYNDFELTGRMKVSRDGDGGVFFGIPVGPKLDETRGYEVQLYVRKSGDKTGTGSLWLGGKVSRASLRTFEVPDRWYSFHIRHEGRSLLVKIDDKTVHDLDDMDHRAGHIALQCARSEGEVHYADLKIRELSPVQEDAAAGPDAQGAAVNAIPALGITIGMVIPEVVPDLVAAAAPRQRLATVKDADYRSSVVFTPDSHCLAVVRSQPNSMIELWELEKGAHLRNLVSKNIAENGTHFRIGDSLPSFSPDGKSIAASTVGDGPHAVEVWDTASCRNLASMVYKHPKKSYGLKVSGPLAVAFSPDGKLLATLAPMEDRLMLVDLSTGKPKHHLIDPTRPLAGSNNEKYLLREEVRTLEFSRDGRLLVCGHSSVPDGLVTLWDATNGKWLRMLVDPALKGSDRPKVSFRYSVDDVAISPDGRTVAATDPHWLKLWDVTTGRLVKSVEGAFGKLTFSPDGLSLATSRGRIWDASTLQLLADLKDSSGDVAFSADGKYFAASREKEIVLYNGALFDGLVYANTISVDEARWLGHALTRLGYLNGASGAQTAVFRADDRCHLAFQLPEGAAADKALLASLRKEVGSIVAERLGPKLSIHLCGAKFKIEQTIEVEVPLVAATVMETASPSDSPAAGASTVTEPETAPQVHADLRGAWRIETMTVNGQAGEFSPLTVYRFADSKMTVEGNKEKSAEFSYSIDATKTPTQLGLVLHRPEGNVLSRMIYKIEGGKLTICHARPGEARPRDFVPRAGEKRTVLTFSRINEESLTSTAGAISP